MPIVNLSAKDIHIIIQAIRIALEDGSLAEFCKSKEVEQLRNKLQNVKDV